MSAHLKHNSDGSNKHHGYTPDCKLPSVQSKCSCRTRENQSCMRLTMLSTCESCSEDTNVMASPLVPKRPARPTCAVADQSSAEEPKRLCTP